MSAFDRPSRLSAPHPSTVWGRSASDGVASAAALLVSASVLAFGASLGLAPGLARADAGAALRPAEPGLRIAVAPFAGEGRAEPVSHQLSQRFERLGVERLLAPGSFGGTQDFDPRPDAVRTWALQAGVDNVIVGRVERTAPRTEARQVEAVVRSGHSGAELFRHAVHVPARPGLGSALDRLAAAIIRDLGGDPLARTIAEASAAPPPVSANAASSRAGAPTVELAATAGPSDPPKNPKTGANEKKKSDSADARVGLGEFKSDAPIEIKADEAEIIAEGQGRRLVFTGSVWVHQDNLTLRSEFLEAQYVEGESEPRLLVARGSVRIEQGNRSARCDLAQYERVSQQITCRGHAELVQGCDVVRGELIVLDLAANKARVEGAASIVISPKQGTDARCSGAASKP